MERKDLASILARPSLTPEQAYRLAGPAQRRNWFGDAPPAKGGPYDLPPTQPAGSPSHLPPGLGAEQRRWERHAAATIFVQQEAVGYFRDLAPVYGVGEMEQRASRLEGRPPVVDRVSFVP
jgi:hypothetical protein